MLSLPIPVAARIRPWAREPGFNQTTGSGNVYIGVGVPGIAGESNTCYIASIFNQTSASGTQVFINSNNKLGTSTSSKRFKDDIKPMDNASGTLFSLKPVTFRYKRDIDPDHTGQFGLVAEDVEKINPDLVIRDKEGKPYSVRYDQVNAMLLNEFLKQHRRVQELETNAGYQQKQIEALTAGLQKVTAQLEVSKAAPQTVTNDQ
jgi:trimeric autotransporter adhesin